MASFVEQVRNNSVALISLVVALTSLGYNTWRNEQTEANRNVREAGFQMVEQLGGLQQVVLFAAFMEGDDRGNPTVGWSHVLAVKDLAYAMPMPVQEAAADLYTAWGQHFEGIENENSSAYQTVNDAIDAIKERILAAIAALD